MTALATDIVTSFQPAINFPRKPFCTNDPRKGLVVRPWSLAKKYRHIQANPPGLVFNLVFDIDRPCSALAWLDGNVVPPTWIAENTKNGHAHYGYALKNPVATSTVAKLEPVRWLAAIQYSLSCALGSDPGYAGLITKNPYSEYWAVQWLNPCAYSLHELSAGLDIVTKPRLEAIQGVGRNVTCFDSVRKWAYKAICAYWGPCGLEKWQDAVKTQSSAINNTFASPLPESEILALAGSVAAWTWKNINPTSRRNLIAKTHTHEKQAERGKKSGEARRCKRSEEREAAKKMYVEGISQKVIAKTVGVTQQTISKWLQS